MKPKLKRYIRFRGLDDLEHSDAPDRGFRRIPKSLKPEALAILKAADTRKTAAVKRLIEASEDIKDVVYSMFKRAGFAAEEQAKFLKFSAALALVKEAR